MLFVVCGGAFGLSVAGLILWFDCVSDSRTGTMYLALVLISAVGSGIYGLISTQRTFKNTPSTKDILAKVALLSAATCGILMLRASAALIISPYRDPFRLLAEQKKIVSIVGVLFALGFCSFAVSYLAIERSARKIGANAEPSTLREESPS